MKKQYITPKARCCEIEAYNILAGSPPDGFNGKDANGDGGYIPEFGDGGNNETGEGM